MKITNLDELCEYRNAKDSWELEHDLYKYTDCGAWITLTNDTVTVGSIVEGSDAEFSKSFEYPFESEDFDNWIDELEELCDEAWHEANDDEDEVILEIGRIAIKSETFCTPWHGKLYCVDICEDAEKRSAWLYNSACGIKSLMWGEEIKNNRDEFLNCVFSNLPAYIEDYAEEYEDQLDYASINSH